MLRLGDCLKINDRISLDIKKGLLSKFPGNKKITKIVPCQYKDTCTVANLCCGYISINGSDPECYCWGDVFAFKSIGRFEEHKKRLTSPV
jgi:hypothetical protein